MPLQSMNLLCSYRYDPLDRLVAYTPSAQASTQRFYLEDRLATEIQGTVQHSIMQHGDQLLAQQRRQGNAAAQTSLLATDQQRSVLSLLDAKRPHSFAYMPYGHCFAGGGLLSLLGFNGERPDSVTGWYLLGNGFRAFNPVLIRFNSPDSVHFSPFGKGGLNAYAYCLGDPMNRSDSNGNASFPWRLVKNNLSQIAKMNRNPITVKTPAWTTRDTQAFAGTEVNLPAPPSSPYSSRRSSSSSINSSQADNTYPSQADIQPLSTQHLDPSAPPQRLRRGAIIGSTMSEDIATVQERYALGQLTPNPSVSGLGPPPAYSDLIAPTYDAAIVSQLVHSRFPAPPHKRQYNIRRS